MCPIRAAPAMRTCIDQQIPGIQEQDTGIQTPQAICMCQRAVAETGPGVDRECASMSSIRAELLTCAWRPALWIPTLGPSPSLTGMNELRQFRTCAHGRQGTKDAAHYGIHKARAPKSYSSETRMVRGRCSCKPPVPPPQGCGAWRHAVGGLDGM